jgi:hypothetical protein
MRALVNFLTVIVFHAITAIAGTLLSCSSAHAAPSAPAGLHVIDTPNDGGESLTVVWAPAPSDGPNAQYQVLIGEGGATDPAALNVVAEFPANTRYVKEIKAAWWTRPAERSWHYYVVRSGKGIR